MRKLVVLILFSLVLSASAQTAANDTLDPNRFNKRFLEKLVLNKVNAYRKSKGLSELAFNPSIYKVSEDHLNYIKNKALTHEQNVPGKVEVHDRLKYYTRARSFAVSENIARTYVLTPTYNFSKNGSSSLTTAYTYDQAAEYLVNAWLQSAYHVSNMSQAVYDMSGVSLYLNPKDKTLTAVQVFAKIRS